MTLSRMVAVPLVLLMAATLIAQDAPAVPDTQPAQADSNELLQNKSDMPGNGLEVYRIVSEKDEIISVLHNGMTVICKRVPSPVAAVRGYAMTGGIYEGQWLGGGLSHLLEHLVAGGSSERRTEAQNRDLLQEIGNDSNAYTTYDHTAFFINTTTPHFEQAVDLVTGWMLGAKITEPEYLREYEVVQRELERNKGNPDMVFWQLIQDNRYKFSPARFPVIGYQEVIQGLKRDDVYNYYKMAYQPNNMIFSVAGNIDPEVMLATVRKFVADSSPGRVFSHNIASEPPVLAPRTVVATFPRLGQARLDLAFPSVRQADPDIYAMDLLAAILGQGESSLLVEQIRDQQQLCSDITCGDFTPSYVTGSFQIDLNLDPDQIAPATRAVMEQIDKIKTNGIDRARLQRAKAQMKISRLKQLQTSQDVAASLAEDYMSCGDAHFSDNYVNRIEALTGLQVQAAARKYLVAGKLLTTALLPKEAVAATGLPAAEDLLRHTAPTTQPQAVAAADSPITKTVLDNGLIVLHRRISTTPLVQINMYGLGGVTTEDAATNGLGNLAMELLPRGTKDRSAEQISDFFDTTGGDLQTACGNNTWYWNVSCTNDDFDRTMEVYSDVVNHPAFADAQVQEIKPRVLARIQGEDAAWDAQAFRYFKQQYFGPQNSPYQFQAIGNKENLAKFTAKDIADWYNQKILKAPRVLAIFGDIDNAHALAIAKKYFGGGENIPAAALTHESPAGAKGDAGAASITVDRVEIQKTDLDVAGVVIGFNSQGVIGEADQPTLTIAQCLTGGYSYPTGYIFETLRGKGLVYEAASENSPGYSTKHPGTFLVYAGCDPKNVNEVIDIILENIARLQGNETDIKMDWFARSKNLITTSDALQNETPAAQAEQAALDELFNLGYDYHAKFPGMINAVTVQNVQDIARARLRNCVITVSTSAPDKVSAKPGKREYASFPPVDLTPRGVQHATPK